MVGLRRAFEELGPGDPADEATTLGPHFFVELGMEPEGRGEVEGLFADQCTGLDGVRCDTR